jgi:hypothetical protein
VAVHATKAHSKTAALEFGSSPAQLLMGDYKLESEVPDRVEENITLASIFASTVRTRDWRSKHALEN